MPWSANSESACDDVAISASRATQIARGSSRSCSPPKAFGTISCIRPLPRSAARTPACTSLDLVGLRGQVLDRPRELPRLLLEREVGRIEVELHALATSGSADGVAGIATIDYFFARPANRGGRFSMNAVAPSIMSAEPIACTSMPRPLRYASRHWFHQTLELIFAISR